MLWILAALETPSLPIPIPPQHVQSRSGGAGGDGGIVQGGGGAAVAAFDEGAELEKVRSYDPSLMLLLQWMTEPVQLDPSNPSNRADMMDVLRHP